MHEKAIEPRLARILLRMAQQWGRREQGSVRLDAPITHQEIANIAGASRQTVSQILKQFERAGWLRVDRRRLIIVEPRELARIVASDSRPATPSEDGA